MHRISAQVGIFVLAGGKSSRMGRDKAFVTLHGQSLLARALETARALTRDVHIVGQAAKFGSFGPVVEDVFPGCGPLGGIHAALRASSSDLSLILAVDLPFVTAELLRLLIARAEQSSALVTTVQTQEGWQPLCAVYRREFADAAEAALRAGRYRIDSLFDERVCAVSEEELQAAGFSTALFRNLNTPEDLAGAAR